MSTPSQIDRYVIERELGKGAFGTVYRAKHAVTGRPIALKVLHARHASDVEMVERFFREARAAASTMSPYIVDVLDASIAKDGSPFLALELLEGEDLEHYLAGRDRLATLDAIEIGRDVASGVADAHRSGIVHRDLKPANVFLARTQDGTRRAKVLDFGMSKLADHRLGGSARTATGAIMGTPLYMAPEQLKGGARDVDASADVYALGAILFRMMTGRPTHEATTIEQLLVRRLTEPAPLASTFAPGLSSTLVHLIARCLEIEPARRTITAAEVARELTEMARMLRGHSLAPAGLSTSSPPAAPLIAQSLSSSMPTLAPQPSRWPRILAGVLVSLLALSCLAGVLVLASMGGLAWLVGDIASSLMEDAESLREATSVPAPSNSIPYFEPPLEPPLEPLPFPPPTPAPAPTIGVGPQLVEGVVLTATVMGMSDGIVEQAIADAARPSLVACRGEEDEMFTLEFMWMGWGTMGFGNSTLDPHSTPRTPAELCTQAAILAASRGRSSTGIITFHVSLEAR